ncbi:hypothetical protein KQ693_05935 [Thermus sp. PS18]|uniref:WD40/YVTN/BNR-like repeat-containing protein n=1 Tax=Thermus sp. PS18 TaxID=2849039 RepID=UPI002263E239|nr:hypothetical protein [Thermus sp. PS18]UZX16569.1 hypothetical protein KQ693_05935 [Thermus sp. PS18]
MKKLTGSASYTAEIWVPEDGVDPRTAASLEPAFQKLLDLVSGALTLPLFIKPWRKMIALSSPLKATRYDPYVIMLNGSTLYRIDTQTMGYVTLTNPGVFRYILYNPYTGSLFAQTDSYGYAVIRKSTDHGATWAVVLNNTSKYSYALGFSPSKIISVGGNDIFVSTDDGNTWTAYTGTADGGSLSANSIYGIVWDGSAWWMSADGRILKSADGISWTRVNGPWNSVLNSWPIVYKNRVYLPTDPIYYWDTASNSFVSTDVFGHLDNRLVIHRGQLLCLNPSYGVIDVEGRVLKDAVLPLSSGITVVPPNLIVHPSGLGL